MATGLAAQDFGFRGGIEAGAEVSASRKVR
jgi:hypothetical protein